VQGVVKVGAVNCDEHQDICSSNGVKGYPTIKAFINGKGVVYNGQREVKVGRRVAGQWCTAHSGAGGGWH
jgi:thioredoxin-like negative regulator of GroEL